MHNVVGFAASPQPLVQAAFAKIAQERMQDLPFLHPLMPVFVPPFTLFEGQWTGCVLTPWMLSLVIFPGPRQNWPLRKVGEKIGLTLPYGEMVFTLGELTGISQYCACSLMSPLAPELTAEEGKALAQDCLRMALSLPVVDPGVSRRALLTRLRGGEHA
ncbi:hydrogenase-2 assembly chaperone [Phytobacter sp. V91]|uniref:hydrogenase-2 assembly chaperone n=1 Tax=Phytobacter sp. V91 TaxID=3369425 RepID=UPI003F5E9F5A